MLFRSATTVTVWREPCCSEFNTIDVKLSVIMVCLPAMFELSGTEKTSENRLCHRWTNALETLLPLCLFK